MIDGFDDQSSHLGKWNVNPAYTTSYPAGRTGGFAIGCSSNDPHAFVKPLGSDEHDTLIMGIAYRALSTSGYSGFNMTFRSDSATTPVTHLTFAINTSMFMTVARGGTIIGTSSQAIPVGVWTYIEAKATLSDTVGSVEVRFDGVTVISLTNVDTKNAGTKTVFDAAAFQVQYSSYQIADDVYVCNGAGTMNNNFLGDVIVEALLPNSNGSSSQFLGSDGNQVDNYLLVDEVPPSTTDYTESGTIGDRDLYALSNPLRPAGVVYGVQVNNYVAKSDAGVQNSKNVLKSGAVVATGNSVVLSTAYAVKTTLWERDPETSTVWNMAKISSLEAGIEAA